MQTSEWKYVHAFGDTSKNELYRLSEDPDEDENLFGIDDPDLRKKTEALRGMLFDNLRKINDPVLHIRFTVFLYGVSIET